MELTLVVSDCPALEGEQLAESTLPRLPALEALLRLADRAPGVGDWREWLWRARVGGEAPSPAAVAAAALPGVTGEVWLAQPVHLQAAADHLRLHAAGLLQLQDEEAQQLADDFARVFGGDGLALHPLCGRFVLSGLAAGAGPPDPAPHAGTRLSAPLRSGAPALRRLVGETELWLHEHPVNLARGRRGQLGVSALWIWGGGRTSAFEVGSGAPAERYLGDDPFVAGLAAARGGVFARAPARIDAAALDAPAQARVTVQVSAAADLRATEPALARIDRDVVAPIAEAVLGGRAQKIELWIAGLRASLRPHHRRRFWRRSRRWWEHAPR